MFISQKNNKNYNIHPNIIICLLASHPIHHGAVGLFFADCEVKYERWTVV